MSAYVRTIVPDYQGARARKERPTARFDALVTALGLDREEDGGQFPRDGELPELADPVSGAMRFR